MALLGILSVLQGFVGSATELLAARLAVGFLLGTDYVVSKAILTECIPRRLRARVLGSLSIAWAGGYACAYFVGVALAGTHLDTWRWMLLTSALPCFLVLPLRITMPESPMWLANHGGGEAAANIVYRTLGAGVEPPSRTLGAPRSRGRWRQLLSPRWRRRTFVACAFFTCQVIPYFALGTFVTQVMAAMSIDSGLLGGVIYNSALLGGAMIGLMVVDRLSRRTFLIGSFSIAAAAMLVLAIWTHVPAVMLTLLFAVFASVLSAASNLVYVYLPELFPTDLRASGIGLAIAISRTGSAVSTFLLPLVVAEYGIRSALAACALVLTLGALTCARWAPETRFARLSALDDIEGLRSR
jgi:putative MFS transporter